jgi:hypothetical protein
VTVTSNPKTTIQPVADRTLNLLTDLIADLQDLKSEYQWIRNIAHLERSHSRNPEQGKVSKRVRADPTGEQAVSMESALKELRQFDKHLHAATRKFWYGCLPAYEAIHRAFEVVDRVYEPTDNRLGRGGISRAELRRARQAKGKREDRGEGWGTG